MVSPDQLPGIRTGLFRTADPHRAAAVAARLRTGYTFVNGHGAAHLDERAPFGGFDGLPRGRTVQGVGGGFPAGSPTSWKHQLTVRAGSGHRAGVHSTTRRRTPWRTTAA
ncbi:hypothetical protein [Geodermatophilus sp. CPCC 205506]|uniref:hypothetical protein n=1 Tax=Geodermatophilus sp. CPCC 205506 TaxID=2936596 RepID=UPI003EF055ED